MKKFLLTFVFCLFAFAFYNMAQAEACVAPLERSELNSVQIYEANDIILQYAKITIEPLQQTYKVTAELSLRNTNDSVKSLLLGIPKNFYNSNASVNSVSVSYNNNKITANADTPANKNTQLGEDQAFYGTYYSFPIEILADDVAYLYITFTADARHEESGLRYVDIPLDVLQYWKNAGGYIDLDIDGALTALYSYDVISPLRPTSVSEHGGLYWDESLSRCTSNITVGYYIDDVVISRFFKNEYSEGDAALAAQLFSQKRYGETIKLIDEKGLDAANNFKFMKMVCYEKLGEKGAAQDILKVLYTATDVCFSATQEYDISEYVSKRMIYTYYDSVPGVSKESFEQRLNVLQTGIKLLGDTRSYAFRLWANYEIRVQSALSGIPVSGSDMGLDNNQNAGVGSGDMTQDVWMNQISQPILIMVGIIIIVVVIFCLTGMFTGTTKKTGRSHNFRKK